ncbi:MAG: hypothetical protein WC657_05760 [Candidatus Paceibacterota bacterium]|jgi:hypothetical protein
MTERVMTESFSEFMKKSLLSLKRSTIGAEKLPFKRANEIRNSFLISEQEQKELFSVFGMQKAGVAPAFCKRKFEN